MTTQFDPYAAPPPGAGYSAVAPAAPALVKAGFGIRFVALLIDSIIVGVAVGILASILRLDAGSVGYQSLNLLLGVAYFAGFWSMNQGQTLGKQVMKIRVVADDGGPITPVKAVIRFVGYYINSIPILIGWFWALGASGKTFADMIAGTRVVKVG